MRTKKKTWTPPAPVVRTPFVPKFAPSERQQKIFDFIKDGNGNLHIEAVAGSGKTTTIVWGMQFMDPYDTAYLAFNNSIVNEVEPKCPLGVVVMTGHKFGNKFLRGIARGAPNQNKVRYLIQEIKPDLNPDNAEEDEVGNVWRELMSWVKLIHFIKVGLVDWKDPNAIVATIYKYDLDIERMGEVIEAVPKIMALNNQMRAGIYDFDDMLYIPYALDLQTREKVGSLVVDESQDLSPAMQDICSRILKPDGRIFTVGDRHQSIYGFAGADTNSVDNLVARFGSSILPLDVCYRCPKKVIELAQIIVPHIKWFDGAEDGEVIRDREDDIKYEKLEDGTMCLARRNSSLVAGAFQAIKAGRRAMIKGKDIGEQLAMEAEAIKADTIAEFISKLEAKREKKLEQMAKRIAQNPSAADVVNDQFDCLLYFAENVSVPMDVSARIRYIFQDSGEGIVFSSMHRSKGLESDNVVLIDSDRLRLTCKMTPEQAQQEANLEYVATTRPKKQLVYKYNKKNA